MPATTSGQSDKADDSKESTQTRLFRLHVTTTNPTICANLESKFRLKDGDREESSDSPDKKTFTWALARFYGIFTWAFARFWAFTSSYGIGFRPLFLQKKKKKKIFTKLEFLRSLVYACRLCDVGNCDRASCVEFRETLAKYNPRCRNWRDLEEWALQLAACICSQKNEAYKRDPWKLPAIFTSMDLLVDKYRAEHSSEDAVENFAGANGVKLANGVELSDVLGVLAWLNGIMSGRYEVIQESNRLLKDNKHGGGGAFTDQILEAMDRANKYKLCPRRVWAVARSLPGSELNFPVLVPPQMDSGVVAHEGHDSCTFDFCEYSRKDFTAQKQRHECLGKNCKLLTFPQQKLREPALAGNPTAWKLDGQSIIEPNQPFMAISHVWVDGTGAGPWEARRVNECLYGFFRGIAEQFQCEGIWWDTICIPREDKKTRNEAINNLQNNYINARITLIHDLYLRKWKWVDAESACFAIVMSMWFSRGWTSLELAKSGRAKVLFNSGRPDCPLVKDLDKDILAKPGEPSSPWRQVATAAIFNLRRKRITGLNDILTALGPRDTSWPKDMAIISRLLAGVEVPVHAPQQDIYQEILRKVKEVYPDHLFHNSVTMKKGFSWCPANLFDMPLALTSKLGSTPLRIQKNGDVVGNWRVFSLEAFRREDYVWTDRHPLIKLRIQSAMKERKKHLFLVEEGLITRALLVKMFRKSEKMPPPRRIHCQFVGSVYFTIPQTPVQNEDGVEIEVRIGDMEGMDELENEKAAFDYVREMARGSGAMLNAENKESGQMRPDKKPDENARLVLNLLEKVVSEAKEFPTTVLHAAAEKGYSSVVRLLLDEEKIPNLNDEDSMGRTALLLAVENGNEEVVELLLERKADPNVADDYERTPLQRAAWGGSKAVVEQLLKYGAKREALDKREQSALLLAAERGEEDVVHILLGELLEKSVVQNVLHRAAWGGSKAVVRLLLEEGFKPDIKDNDGQTALHVAVERGHVSVVRMILEKSRDFANVTNGKGQTALFEAAKKGHEDIVRLLLMKGAKPDFKDDHSRTALSLAAEHGHKAVVELLLKSRVELDHKVPLEYAAAGGHLDIVRLLLDSKGVDSECFRKTLVAAVKGGHDGIFKLVIGNGTGIGTKRESGELLRTAARGGHESLVQLLLDKGVDFDSEDEQGKTPLYYAIYGGHYSVVMTLLQLGVCDFPHYKLRRKVLKLLAQILKDTHWATLLEQAASCGSSDMVYLLLENDDYECKLYSDLLKRAAINGHDAVVELLWRKIGELQQGQTIMCNIEVADLLFSVARRGHEAVMRQLLRRDFWTPWTRWTRRTLLRSDNHVMRNRKSPPKTAILPRGEWEGMRYLSPPKTAILPRGEWEGMRYLSTALRIAGENGKESVVQLLLDEKLDVDSTTNQLDEMAKDEEWHMRARPVLHHAVMKGHEGVVRILLERDANVNYQAMKRNEGVFTLRPEMDANQGHVWDWEGQTALHLAAENGHEAIARLLIEKGADLERSFYTEDRPWDRGSRPLHLAVKNGHHKVARMLIDKGVAINKRRHDGATALHIATMEGHIVIVRLLIKKGADINRSDSKAKTALDLAKLSGHEGIAQLLIESGAELGAKEMSCWKDRRTAFQLEVDLIIG